MYELGHYICILLSDLSGSRRSSKKYIDAFDELDCSWTPYKGDVYNRQSHSGFDTQISKVNSIIYFTIAKC